MVEMMGLEVVAEMMGLEQRLKYNGRSSVNFSVYCLNVRPQVCPDISYSTAEQLQ